MPTYSKPLMPDQVRVIDFYGQSHRFLRFLWSESHIYTVSHRFIWSEYYIYMVRVIDLNGSNLTLSLLCRTMFES
jgi:hypothetical protein